MSVLEGSTDYLQNMLEVENMYGEPGDPEKLNDFVKDHLAAFDDSWDTTKGFYDEFVKHLQAAKKSDIDIEEARSSGGAEVAPEYDGMVAVPESNLSRDIGSVPSGLVSIPVEAIDIAVDLATGKSASERAVERLYSRD